MFKLTIKHQNDVDDVVLTFSLLISNNFIPFSSVSIVDFEQVNLTWEKRLSATKLLLFFIISTWNQHIVFLAYAICIGKLWLSLKFQWQKINYNKVSTQNFKLTLNKIHLLFSRIYWWVWTYFCLLRLKKWHKNYKKDYSLITLRKSYLPVNYDMLHKSVHVEQTAISFIMLVLNYLKIITNLNLFAQRFILKKKLNVWN